MIAELWEFVVEDVPNNKSNVLFEARDYVFENEDSTLGNLVQTFLLKHERVKYCGYNTAHPLTSYLIIRIGLDDNKDIHDFFQTQLGLLADNINKSIQKL